MLVLQYFFSAQSTFSEEIAPLLKDGLAMQMRWCSFLPIIKKSQCRRNLLFRYTVDVSSDNIHHKIGSEKTESVHTNTHERLESFPLENSEYFLT